LTTWHCILSAEFQTVFSTILPIGVHNSLVNTFKFPRGIPERPEYALHLTITSIACNKLANPVESSKIYYS